MITQKIGALWVRKSKDGRTYMSGLIKDMHGEIQIAVFKNDKKEKENQPDYNIVLSGNKPKVAGAQNNGEKIPF